MNFWLCVSLLLNKWRQMFGKAGGMLYAKELIWSCMCLRREHRAVPTLMSSSSWRWHIKHMSYSIVFSPKESLSLDKEGFKCFWKTAAVEHPQGFTGAKEWWKWSSTFHLELLLSGWALVRVWLTAKPAGALRQCKQTSAVNCSLEAKDRGYATFLQWWIGDCRHAVTVFSFLHSLW